MKKIPYKALSHSLQQGLLKGWHILTLNPYDSYLIPRSNIAVSVERENVTIACLSRFASRYTVKKENGYPFVDEAYPSANNVLSALESFTQSSGLSPQPVTLALPKAWVVTRKWQLPRTIEAEMAMAITHEMDVITPFSSDEVYFDYQILSRDENTIHFLVAAIRKDKIQPYLDLLKENKFPVNRITINIAAFGTACTYLKKGNKKEFVVCAIDKKEIELAAISNGRLVFLYTYTLKGNEIEDALKIEELLNSAVSTLTDSEAHIIAAINLDTSFLKYVLQDKFGSRVIEMDECNTKVLSLKRKESGRFSAAGAAMETVTETNSIALNLLRCGQPEHKRETYVLSLLLVILLFVLFGFNLYQPVYKGRLYVQVLDEKIEIFAKDVNRVNKIKEANEQVKKEINTLNEFGKNAFLPLDILKELTQLLPVDSWVTRLTVKPDYIEIEGYSDSATILIVKLEESSLFKKVGFSSPTIKDRQLNKDRYRIRADIEGVEKDEEKLSQKLK